MKKQISVIIGLMMVLSSFGQVQFYLGLDGGAGAMLTHDQLVNVGTSDGIRSIFKSDEGWSAHAKAQALLGFGRIRLGYQFMYNFSAPTVVNTTPVPSVDNNSFTTYFNSSQVHFFGQYFLTELELIRTAHFDLVPGLALGSFTGFKVDNSTGNEVGLSTDTHHRFSMGAELNGEVKFGRCAFIFGPNYYLFSMDDKFHSDWREYQHFIGADIGLRVNLAHNYYR
jgi:hypothetical protein